MNQIRRLAVVLVALGSVSVAYADLIPAIDLDEFQIWDSDDIIQNQSYSSGAEFGTVAYDTELLTLFGSYGYMASFGSGDNFPSSLGISVRVNEFGISEPGTAAWIGQDGTFLMLGSVVDVGWDSSRAGRIDNQLTHCQEDDDPELCFLIVSGLQFEIIPTFLDDSVSDLGPRIGVISNIGVGAVLGLNPWGAAFECGPGGFNGCSHWSADGILSLQPKSVPEPGTLALLGIGLFGMGLARRRKKA